MQRLRDRVEYLEATVPGHAERVEAYRRALADRCPQCGERLAECRETYRLANGTEAERCRVCHTLFPRNFLKGRVDD